MLVSVEFSKIHAMANYRQICPLAQHQSIHDPPVLELLQIVIPFNELEDTTISFLLNYTFKIWKKSELNWTSKPILEITYPSPVVSHTILLETDNELFI